MIGCPAAERIVGYSLLKPGIPDRASATANVTFIWKVEQEVYNSHSPLSLLLMEMIAGMKESNGFFSHSASSYNDLFYILPRSSSRVLLNLIEATRTCSCCTVTVCISSGHRHWRKSMSLWMTFGRITSIRRIQSDMKFRGQGSAYSFLNYAANHDHGGARTFISLRAAYFSTRITWRRRNHTTFTGIGVLY